MTPCVRICPQVPAVGENTPGRKSKAAKRDLSLLMPAGEPGQGTSGWGLLGSSRRAGTDAVGEVESSLTRFVRPAHP